MGDTIELQLLRNFLFSDYGCIILLFFLIVFETLWLLLKYPAYMLGKFGKYEQKIFVEVRECSAQSIKLATITFAAISFIIASFRLEIALVENVILVLVFGLSLFFVSYKLGDYAATYRIIGEVQQIVFDVAFLSILLGLWLFFANHFSQAYLIASVTLTILFGIHFVGYIHRFYQIKDIVDTKSRSMKQEEELEY